ncbi:DUF4287 domain-containing protein [Sphingomonas sp. ac-8]|uniref:DUF4287 domain-containing protein n=1 Tax=Sphingomonas sp. ac-8 TaxID=3242977 RepID=UPI003A7FCD74
MSFQAYLDTIERTTGKTPAGFTADGGIAPGVKATRITDWLKSDYGLGHGHAMAIYALLKGTKREGDA